LFATSVSKSLIVLAACVPVWFALGIGSVSSFYIAIDADPEISAFSILVILLPAPFASNVLFVNVVVELAVNAEILFSII
jgi:hypothetical protein